MKFSQILTNTLDEKGLTAYQMSKDTGITDSLIGYWKNGTRTPGSDNLIQIAKYLDVSTDYLLGLDHIPNRKQSDAVVPPNNEDERELLNLFNQLSERGKGQIIERMKVIKEDEEKSKIKDNKLETA